VTEQRSDADQVHADAYELLVNGWLTLPEAAELLGVSPNRIRQLVTDRQLLAVRRGENNALMVPADFVQDGRVLKGLPGVLTLLKDARYADDEALRWLYTDDDLPGSPVQALIENRGTEVKRRAQALGF
jgi:excisionase family DNA binding protein